MEVPRNKTTHYKHKICAMQVIVTFLTGQKPYNPVSPDYTPISATDEMTNLLFFNSTILACKLDNREFCDAASFAAIFIALTCSLIVSLWAEICLVINDLSSDKDVINFSLSTSKSSFDSNFVVVKSSTPSNWINVLLTSFRVVCLLANWLLNDFTKITFLAFSWSTSSMVLKGSNSWCDV